MGWQEFDFDADNYEAWYASPEGGRADRAEQALVDWLLQHIPDAVSALEVGCGTGHFTVVFASRGLFAVGLDRAPAMIDGFRRMHPELPAILGDAHELPFRDGAVDVTAFVASLEFMTHPEAALAEAVRVSRKGLILVVLNKWSVGGLSRRWGSQSQGRRLGRARDFSLAQLRKLVRVAASDRPHKLKWMSALYPVGSAARLTRAPLGDVNGMVVTFGSSSLREDQQDWAHTYRAGRLFSPGPWLA